LVSFCSDFSNTRKEFDRRFSSSKLLLHKKSRADTTTTNNAKATSKNNGTIVDTKNGTIASKDLDPLKCFPKALCGLSAENAIVARRRQQGLINDYFQLLDIMKA